MSDHERRDWKALGEALTVFALIMLYIWRERLYHPWTAWAVLGAVIATHFLHGENPRRLGFGWREVRGAFRAVLPWLAAVALVLTGAGLLAGTVRKTTVAQAALGILGYSVWGLLQQYLLNAYFVNRLAQFRGRTRGEFVPLAAGALFAFAHLPNWFLMLVTFAGGYTCARLYLRFRSLYVLALAHGTVAYFLLMVVPEPVSAHFLVGPRYLLHMYGWYPELLL
jgi:hypothetical protein